MNIDKIKMEVPYFQVPNAIYLQGLDVYEIAVYTYLCRCGNNGGNAFPSYTDIAEKCGMSRRKAIDTIDLLVNRELLIKQKRDTSSNIYIVVTNLPSAQHALPSAQYALPTSAQHSPPSAPCAPKKELLKKNYIKKEQLNNRSCWEKIQTKYFKTYNCMLPTTKVPLIQSYIDDGMEEELILYALDLSLKARAKHFNYTKSILDSWLDKGLMTLNKVKESEEEEVNGKVASARKMLKELELEG